MWLHVACGCHEGILVCLTWRFFFLNIVSFFHDSSSGNEGSNLNICSHRVFVSWSDLLKSLLTTFLWIQSGTSKFDWSGPGCLGKKSGWSKSTGKCTVVECYHFGYDLNPVVVIKLVLNLSCFELVSNVRRKRECTVCVKILLNHSSERISVCTKWLYVCWYLCQTLTSDCDSYCFLFCCLFLKKGRVIQKPLSGETSCTPQSKTSVNSKVPILKTTHFAEKGIGQHVKNFQHFRRIKVSILPSHSPSLLFQKSRKFWSSHFLRIFAFFENAL